MSSASSIPYILQPRQARDVKRAGGKAAALAALARSGLAIPGWFVVTPAAFEASLSAEGRALIASSGTQWNVESIRQALKLPDDLTAQLQAAIDHLCADGVRVAVRSSAAEEDATGHSFAGQFESHLNVAREDVARRIIDVWLSGFSQRVRTYRAEHRLPSEGTPPAVLVQRMVRAEAAGVAFGADPVTGRRGVVVIGAVPGFGTALVSGDADADTFHVDRDNVIVLREIAHKRIAHRADSSDAHGVVEMPLDDAAAREPAIADVTVRAIAAMARRAEQHAGRPQDIEWAIEAGTPYLLQSRPITSLDHLSDPDGARLIWDNSNIIESYSGVTTPLTFSFARRAYEEVYREFCVMMGVHRDVIAEHSETFRCMLGLIRGRVYYNLLNWYRVLAMLPGFRFNQRFMEQMMGVKEGLPESVQRELSAAGKGAKVRDGMRLLRSIVGMLWNGITLRRRSRAFHARLNHALGTSESLPHGVETHVDWQSRLPEMRPDELAAYYRNLERQLLTRWDAPIVNDFFAMLYHGLLRRKCQDWCADSGGNLHNDLLCGEGGMISVQPAQRLQRMAEAVQGDAAMVDLLCRGELDEILDTLPSHPQLAHLFDDYITAFGDRCLDELKLESLTLHDHPLPLLRGVGHLAQRQTTNPVDPRQEPIEIILRRNAERQVRLSLRRRPLRRMVFNWILRNARHRVRDRENLRFERTRVFGRVRRIFLELGRRLHAVDVLDDPRDVLFLEVAEALGFVDGTTATTDLKALCATRKREYALFYEMPPLHERFETRGMVHRGNSFAPRAVASAAVEGEERTGLGCCPGIVRARVRVIHDPVNAELRSGEILVALRTDPGWIMLFPSAAGLLVERGSLLSHSAIVARELGIPAIVSIPGVTAWLCDGDEVEMDGSTGRVRRIETASSVQTIGHTVAATEAHRGE